MNTDKPANSVETRPLNYVEPKLLRSPILMKCNKNTLQKHKQKQISTFNENKHTHKHNMN